jgi:hypothetical protein
MYQPCKKHKGIIYVTMAKRNTFVLLASPVCHMALTANLLVAQMCKTDTWTVQSVVDLLSLC